MGNSSCKTTVLEDEEFHIQASRDSIKKYTFEHAMLNDNLISVVKSINLHDLCVSMPICLGCIRTTPIWLRDNRRKLTKALNARLAKSPALRQFLEFALTSSKHDKRVIRDLSESLWISGEKNATFNMIDKYEMIVVKFWRDWATRHIGRKNFYDSEEKRIRMISKEQNIYDPVNPTNGVISQIRVIKVMTSKTQPLLLELYTKRKGKTEKLSSTMLLKYGDDMRQDAAVMHIFQMMNYMWSNENLANFRGSQVEALTYQVLPIDEKTGIIECVQDVKTLQFISDYKEDFEGNDEILNRLCATAAGSYIASYVLGVQDRHWDNVLIKSDGTTFHIDFGFCLGSKPGFDAKKLAITKDLYSMIGEDRWEEFVELCVSCFRTIRRHSTKLMNYMKLIFSNQYEPSFIETFLDSRLNIAVKEDEALDKLRSKILKAPGSWKTWMKNTIHGMKTGAS